jgi:hypothetical protein
MHRRRPSGSVCARLAGALAAALGALGPAGAQAAAGAAAAHGPPAKESVTIGGLRATVWASSTLVSRDGRHSVKSLFDGKSETAWVEGADGVGNGESITVEFEKPVTLSGFVILPGYAKSVKTFVENVAPTAASLRLLDDDSVVASHGFTYFLERGDGAGKCTYQRTAANLMYRVAMFREPVTGKAFRLEIMSTGLLPHKFPDLAVSEWTFVREDQSGSDVGGGALPRPIAAIAELIRSYARKGGFDKGQLAGDAKVANLLEPAGFADGSEEEQRMREKLVEYLHRLDAKDGADPLDNFNAVARRSLVKTLVLVVPGQAGLYHVIGEPLILENDVPRQVRYFPAIRVREAQGQYRISEAGALVRLGGRCRPSGRCDPVCEDLPDPSASF